MRIKGNASDNIVSERQEVEIDEQKTNGKRKDMQNIEKAEKGLDEKKRRTRSKRWESSTRKPIRLKGFTIRRKYHD